MTAREVATIAIRTCQWAHIFQIQVRRFWEDWYRESDGYYPWDGDDENSIFVGDRIFMISAIQHVIDGLVCLKDELLSRGESGEKIERILNNIVGGDIKNNLKLLRNMNEHDIQYISKKGRKRNQFESLVSKNQVNYYTNAHWTIEDRKNGNFFIGNIDLRALEDSVKEQIGNIDKMCSKICYKYYFLDENVKER